MGVNCQMLIVDQDENPNQVQLNDVLFNKKCHLHDKTSTIHQIQHCTVTFNKQHNNYPYKSLTQPVQYILGDNAFFNL